MGLQHLGGAAQQGHQQQGCGQMGADDVKAQQLGDRQGAKGSLSRHQQQRQTTHPREPSRQLIALDQCHGQQHDQANADKEGIEAMEPLQEHLKAHLLGRQQAAVAEGPIRAGQTGLHHPRCTTDRHQGDQCHHQLPAERQGRER